MSGDSIGKLFKVTNWGESHGKAIGVVIEGCPPKISIDERDIQPELDRRRPGQSDLTTQRDEADKVEILSGTYDGKTTGAPISLIIFNKDQRPKDYDRLSRSYRPSHADFTYEKKYGIRDPNGGGRSSARITAGSVAAGAIARKILSDMLDVEIISYVKQVKDVLSDIKPETISRSDVDKSPLRCPDTDASEKMSKLIRKARDDGDSLGGVIECIIKNVPVGLGEPVYDKLDADLGKAMLSINATKGFEIGSGFKAAEMTGSEHNDPFSFKDGKIITKTNNSGGIQAGISNGMPIVFRIAFKPTSTIKKAQETVGVDGKPTTIEGTGRHDPCVLPRAVPIVEAMAAIILCDHLLRQRAIRGDI